MEETIPVKNTGTVIEKQNVSTVMVTTNAKIARRGEGRKGEQAVPAEGAKVNVGR